MRIIFSDLDGTLLDHFTYSYDEARPGIDLCDKMGAPLVLVSSKTLPEMEILLSELGLSSPCVFENGAGIAWRKGDSLSPEIMGKTLQDLHDDIPGVEGLLGSRIKPITDMDIDELANITGLPPERARLAQKRQASLPFFLETDKDVSPERLRQAADTLAGQGLTLTRGGRFFHLSSREATKGRAVERVTAFYKKKYPRDSVQTVGIGDSENDIPMLRVVDIPILVRRHTGDSIRSGITGVTITAGIGPAGFSEGMRLLAAMK